MFINFFVGSSISRRIRGRSMYTMPKGDDEFANLMSRPATSAPTTMGLYQNDDPLLTYGTIDTKTYDRNNKQNENINEFIHV